MALRHRVVCRHCAQEPQQPSVGCRVAFPGWLSGIPVEHDVRRYAQLLEDDEWLVEIPLAAHGKHGDSTGIEIHTVKVSLRQQESSVLLPLNEHNCIREEALAKRQLS